MYKRLTTCCYCDQTLCNFRAYISPLQCFVYIFRKIISVLKDVMTVSKMIHYHICQKKRRKTNKNISEYIEF
jgi:hypothetical protein